METGGQPESGDVDSNTYATGFVTFLDDPESSQASDIPSAAEKMQSRVESPIYTQDTKNEARSAENNDALVDEQPQQVQKISQEAVSEGPVDVQPQPPLETSKSNDENENENLTTTPASRKSFVNRMNLKLSTPSENLSKIPEVLSARSSEPTASEPALDGGKKLLEASVKEVEEKNEPAAASIPETDLRTKCRLQDISKMEGKKPTVDIIAIHDLDECLDTAWIFNYAMTKVPNTTKYKQESKGSSLEHGLQYLQTQGGAEEDSKKQGDGTRLPTVEEGKVDVITAFKNGKITSEGRVKKVEEYLSTPISTLHTSPLTMKPPNQLFEIAKEIDKGKAVHQELSPSIPPFHSDSAMARASQEDEHAKASEKDHRSHLQSTEAEGTDRRRPVNWLQDSNMIPSAIPEARVLCYTYPNISAATPNEYLDKVSQRLLTSLITMRMDEHFSNVPIVFVGYGFGGLILQKLMILAAARKKEKEPAQLLSLVAGLIVLDTPFPINRDPFPPDANRRQEFIIKRLKDCRNKLDSSMLWESFDNERKAYQLPLVWFYKRIPKTSKLNLEMNLIIPPPPKPSRALARLGICCFAMASDPNRRLSRFPNTKDPVYLNVLSQIQRCFLFMASSKRELENLLRHLITNTDVAVDIEDEVGRSALHCAASAPNNVAVTILLKKGKARIMHKDMNGQTPLHSVVRKATEANPLDDEDQKPYRDVIIQLMRHSPSYPIDRKGKSAWDYARKVSWVTLLKGLLIGPSSSSEQAEALDSLKIPAKNTPQRRACQNMPGVLAEFYLNNGMETRSLERPSVFEIIYEEGPPKILDRARPKLTARDTLQCCWYHLPANNEQWVHDLFIALGIKDDLMANYRHEGSKLHGRYMIAQATKYKQGVVTNLQAKDSTTNKTSMVDKSAIALFMPILAFETSKNRKEMSKVIRKILENKKIKEESNDVLLLKGYLGDDNSHPFHCRRTLDQFYYHMLESTEDRDNGQVIYRWGRKKSICAHDAPILMVDQLWLWILHDGTLITSFPNTWDKNLSYSLKKLLDMEIQKTKQQRRLIKSVDDLVHLIIKLAVDFFRREGPSKLKFQESFQSSISNIAEQEAKEFQRFKTLTKKLNSEELSEERRTKNIVKLFQLNTETDLVVEIKDILDELNMVYSLLSQQSVALEKLKRLCSTKGGSENLRELDNSFSPPLLGKSKDKKQVHFPDDEFTNPEKEIPLLKNYALVDENHSVVLENLQIVQDMIDYAERLTTLLDLKQRQANAWEARFAREASQQSQRQNNTMLVFTLVSIVFLPMSFMSSFFALQVNAFPKDNTTGNISWPLHQVSLYLFGITALVFIPLPIIALYINEISVLKKKAIKKLRGEGNNDEEEDEDEREKENEGTEYISDIDDSDTENSSHHEYEYGVESTILDAKESRWSFGTFASTISRIFKRQSYSVETDDDSEYLHDVVTEKDFPLVHLFKFSLRKMISQRLFNHHNHYEIEDDVVIVEERYGRARKIIPRRWYRQPHSLNFDMSNTSRSRIVDSSGSRRSQSIENDDSVIRPDDRSDFSYFERPHRRESNRTVPLDIGDLGRQFEDPPSGSGANARTGIASRLGAVLPVFRRPFAQRRRVSDIESLGVD